jgi:dienelactone hydrolase
MGSQAVAQEALVPPKGDGLIEKYLTRDAEEVARRVFDGATTKEEWEASRPRLKRELFQMLGLWPIPGRTDLKAQVTGTLEAEGPVAIEKIHFQSRPGLYVTGNLYRPKDVSGKLPTILYVCGHSPRGRDGNKTAYQDHGMWFARHGYVAFLIDTLQLGELAGVHHGTYNLDRWWWHSAGYTSAGVECWNGVRAIDYLLTRPDVDPGRIGVTGISGGGAATFWIAAADDRVACAVPVSGMSDLESYVSHRIINEHCDCMFIYNTFRWQWTTIAALIAPRPMLFANSDRDPIFPMDGNRRVIDRLRRFYTMLGHPERIAEHVSPGGHAYRPDLRLAVFRWMNRHLKNDSSPVEDADYRALDGKRLRVFPDDGDLPTDALNARIDESFVPRHRPTPPAPADLVRWGDERMAELRSLAFRTFPERIPSARPERPDDKTSTGRWFQTEPGIQVVLFGDESRIDTPEATLVVLNEGDSPELPLTQEPRSSTVVLAPRGVGPTAWVRKSPPNYVERSHALLGRTVDEGRVWDVAAVARWLTDRSEGKTRWRVAGRGPAGIVAAYAALFEPEIAGVTLIDPPVSHHEGPYFLNVLQVLDIPDALGLLAPRPLRIVEGRADAFVATRTLYQRAGAETKLEWK